MSLRLNSLLALLFAFEIGCGASALETQAKAAHAMAGVIEHSGGLIQERRFEEQERAVNQAPSQSEARAAVALVREKWEPVLLSYDSVRLSYNVWLDALILASDSDGTGNWSMLVSDMLSAYNALSRAAQRVGVELPAIPELLGGLYER